MGVIIGLLTAMVCVAGGFWAMGGHIMVVWQPFEFIIVGGAAIGAFIVANPARVVMDTAGAVRDALFAREPRQEDYLSLLGLLFALVRELRSKPRNEVEHHLDRRISPRSSRPIRAWRATRN